MKKNIVIIGQGEIGKAIAFLLKRQRAHVIDCWDIDPTRCPTRKALETIIPKASIIFLCVPSWCLQGVADSIRSLLRHQTVLVTLSKGLDKQTHQTVSERMQTIFRRTQPVVLLSGPMLAEEIVKGKRAACVAASKHAHARKDVLGLFKDSALHVQSTTDVVGASLCGVLKNVYAIGLGIAAAKQAGDNYRGWYVQEAVREMSIILSHAGGHPETAYGPAGLGDLIATGFSSHSSNYSYGYALAKRKRSVKKAEGVESLASVIHLSAPVKHKLPLLWRIKSVVSGSRPSSSLIE